MIRSTYMKKDRSNISGKKTILTLGFWSITLKAFSPNRSS